jgi:hypothetical protein
MQAGGGVSGERAVVVARCRARSMQQDPYQQRESAGTGRHARRQRKRMQRSCSRLWGGRRGGRREAHEDGTRAPRRTFARATSLGFLDGSVARPPARCYSLSLSLSLSFLPARASAPSLPSRRVPRGASFLFLPSVQCSHPYHPPRSAFRCEATFPRRRAARSTSRSGRY